MKNILILIGILISFDVGYSKTARKIYISKVEKNTVFEFLQRMVTPKYHIVATNKALPNTIYQIDVIEAENERLYMVELHPLEKKKPKNIIDVIDNIAIVARPINSLKNHDDSHSFALPIESSNTYISPAILRKKIINKKTPLQPDIQINRSFLYQKLRDFTGVNPAYYNSDFKSLGERQSSNGKKEARQYLKEQFEDLGFTVSFHSYQGRYHGVNIIAEKKSQHSKRFLMVSSHYDSVATAGADDDGTGVIAGLALAHAFKDVDLQCGLRIVMFDQEELGLIGSKQYAAYMHDQGEFANNFMGLIQLEMLGWDADDDGEFHIIDCHENQSKDLTDILEDVIYNNGIQLTRREACTNRSDHASFWAYNQAAVVVSQNFFGGDSNPCYHKKCDQFKNINLKYYYKIVQTTALAVYQLIA